MIVVDCSVVVDALGVADDTDDLRSRLAGEELHTPALIDFEVVSVLRGLIRAHRVSPTRAEDLLTDFDDLPLRRWPLADPLRRRALSLRENFSAYDASYVALAEAIGCTLLTRDARLARSPGAATTIELG